MSPYYRFLDRHSILRNAFFPRRGLSPCPDRAFDLRIPVDGDVSLHCRFYYGRDGYPTILYFHGNGEVAGDYDGFAPYYHRAGTNLAVAEYRGYGASSGIPTIWLEYHAAALRSKRGGR
ncbi:MAG: hypothetical protein AB1796_11505 [Bacillota bacterium]